MSFYSLLFPLSRDYDGDTDSFESNSTHSKYNTHSTLQLFLLHLYVPYTLMIRYLPLIPHHSNIHYRFTHPPTFLPFLPTYPRHLPARLTAYQETLRRSFPDPAVRHRQGHQEGANVSTVL